MFQLFTPDQARIFIDTEQSYLAYRHARERADSYQGNMHWKTVNGHRYLYKAQNSRKPAKSLGPDSVETQRAYQNFCEGKTQARARLEMVATTIKLQARLCKAVKLNRVPALITAILRQMELAGWLGKNLSVIGTNSLYAYEVAAGGRLNSSLTATTDIDFLWDARSRLVFTGNIPDIEITGLIGLLRKVDKSFEPVYKHGFRAVNSHGFFVDLVKPAPPFWKQEAERLAEEDALWASEIPSLKWLISSPKFTHTVIGDDGFPATMVTPDPRAFALHKLWLSRQIDREPIKKERDRLQALAVAKLVIKSLPHLPFAENQLKAFPIEIVQAASDAMDDLPNGFFTLC